jgi:hypothetical protein
MLVVPDSKRARLARHNPALDPGAVGTHCRPLLKAQPYEGRNVIDRQMNTGSMPLL